MCALQQVALWAFAHKTMQKYTSNDNGLLAYTYASKELLKQSREVIKQSLPSQYVPYEKQIYGVALAPWPQSYNHKIA